MIPFNLTRYARSTINRPPHLFYKGEMRSSLEGAYYYLVQNMSFY